MLTATSFAPILTRTTEDNRRLSALADARVVWGGDAKIKRMSCFPTRPDGITLNFPDRHSSAAIATGSYIQPNEARRDELAERFFNDVFWFDQMGCGSPRVLYWVGNETQQDVEDDFLRRVARVVKTRATPSKPASPSASSLTPISWRRKD
jgi:hypothetical protein